MHKKQTRSMQRFHKVHEIDAQPVGRRVQDDLLPDLANMTLPQCDAERRRLLHEKCRAEQELVAAKRQRDATGISVLGLRIQGFSNRLGLLNRHMKSARHDIESTALKQAVIELLGEETWQRIIARKVELRQAMIAGASA